MGDEKNYTIKEISNELGVTKSAIQQRLTSKFRDKFVSKKLINNRVTLVVSEKGYLQLKQNIKNKNSHNESDKDVIEVLKQQLVRKDEQIEKLQILLNQSQQLQLKQSEKIKMLEMKKRKHWWQKIFK